MQVFDFTAALPTHTASPHTQRAYYRWVDRYLVDVAGLSAQRGAARQKRMETLTTSTLQRHLTARKFYNWLNRLTENGQGRQGLDQARASIVTLAQLMADAGHLEADIAAAIKAVSVPPVQRKESPERLLNAQQIEQLMQSVRQMATSPGQLQRNDVVAMMLCTMVLRREELSVAKWGDVSVTDGSVVLRVGRNAVPVPRKALASIDSWRKMLQSPPAGSPLIRRIWKGGRIAKNGLSPDGIWLIIRNAARHAGLGHVTPDDLRRSSAALLYQNGTSPEDLNKLLRHRSLLVTERFLSRLPLPDDAPPEQE
ncbi:MAG: tyrosine-type recombinase/integrase [Aggregatilineales bacterium]